MNHVSTVKTYMKDGHLKEEAQKKRKKNNQGGVL